MPLQLTGRRCTSFPIWTREVRAAKHQIGEVDRYPFTPPKFTSWRGCHVSDATPAYRTKMHFLSDLDEGSPRGEASDRRSRSLPLHSTKVHQLARVSRVGCQSSLPDEDALHSRCGRTHARSARAECWGRERDWNSASRLTLS